MDGWISPATDQITDKEAILGWVTGRVTPGRYRLSSSLLCCPVISSHREQSHCSLSSLYLPALNTLEVSPVQLQTLEEQEGDPAALAKL